MTAHLSAQTRDLVARVLLRWMPRERIGVLAWAEANRTMAPGTTAIPGPYSVDVTPVLRALLDAVDEPGIWKVVAQKSAQVGWTDGVVNNVVGRHIAAQPGPALVLFPREGSAKDYAREKFEPMVVATPVLSGLIDTRSRTRGQSALHRSFPSGFIKFVGSNSPSSVKSTPARLVIVEEPDDAARDVRGQGDAIKLAEERSKTFADRLLLIGGTPSLDGISAIQQEMLASDQRHFHVRCHECGEAAPMEWEHVTWNEDAPTAHPVWGDAQPDTARYACPSCGALWDDDDRRRSIHASADAQAAGEEGVGWVASRTSRGVAGFYLSELLSLFPSSTLPILVERYLEAEHESAAGEHGAAIAFRNSALGMPWEMRSDSPDVERLAERGEDYDWWTAPAAAGVLTAGVDVQHDRLHVDVYAWGRGEECWLVAREVIAGVTVDRADGCWQALDAFLLRQCEHPSGTPLRIAALSIDSSDGQTSDAVYAWVRKHRHRRNCRVLAVKGSSQSEREIFSVARPVDTTRGGKAARYGLRAYPVGASKAKDLIAARIKLAGHGPGRMHWPACVDGAYFAEMTSEVKWPGRGGRMAWQLKAGARNEDLDCTVYALHAARGLRLHQWSEAQWVALENRLKQAGPDLVEQAEGKTESRPAIPPAARRPKRSRRGGGWVGGWKG